MNQVVALLTSEDPHGCSLMMGAAASGSVDVWDAVTQALRQTREAERVRTVLFFFAAHHDIYHVGYSCVHGSHSTQNTRTQNGFPVFPCTYR